MYLFSATQQVHFTWNIGNQWSNWKGRIYFSLSNYCSTFQSSPSYCTPMSTAAPAVSVMQHSCNLPHVQSGFCRCPTLKIYGKQFKATTTYSPETSYNQLNIIHLEKKRLGKNNNRIFIDVFLKFQWDPWAMWKQLSTTLTNILMKT